MVSWKTTLHRRPWVLSKSIHSFLPLRYYSPESLTAHKTPWPFLLLPRGLSPYVNSSRGKEKGGAAYRRRERSSEGRVSFGRSWRSQRGTARQRWWPESAGPRAQAGELVGAGAPA
jgi:hypothetical protein